MTLVSIDTTPNPNSMKLNLSNVHGISGTFTQETADSAPQVIQPLLDIKGIVSVYATADFLTLNRDARVDWQSILKAAKQVFAEQEQSTRPAIETQRQGVEPVGQVKVLVQTFRQIPIQVKATDGVMEARVALPARFGDTARELQAYFGVDYLKERYWADWGVRYGGLSEVAQEVAEEIESLLDESQLAQQKNQAFAKETEPIKSQPTIHLRNESTFKLDSVHWEERFQALQALAATEDTLALLMKALQDEKPQIRRWTAAKLAGVKTAQSVAVLCQALLNDSNVGVRRTAGDSLSDIGDVSAQRAMCQALSDPNKLVRWRAARFLAEVGTETALPDLEKAKDDPEYEVRLEVEAAINHITQGSKAAMPVWKLMTQDL